MTGREEQASQGGAGDAEGRVYRRHRDVAFTRFGDQGLIVVPGQSMNVVVNEIGLRVFELLDGETALGGLADIVRQEYDGANRGEIVADIVEILEELDAKGAVELMDAS